MRRLSAAFAAGFLVFASRVSGQAPGTKNPHDLHLRIEVNQSSSHAGEPILLRLTFENVSGHPTAFPHGFHTGLVRIRAYDSAGKEIPHNGSPLRVRMGEPRRVGGPRRMLEAGGSVTLAGWNPPGEWLDLRDWGYDLWTPGSYTVADPDLLSNRVEITVAARIPGTDSAAVAQEYYTRRITPPDSRSAEEKMQAYSAPAAVWARIDSMRAWKARQDSLARKGER